MTLIYHLLLPFFWCIPISLVATSDDGNAGAGECFCCWTRAAFGDFWGFLAGWWNWCASFPLGSTYAVLFTDYLSFFFPWITGRKHYGCGFREKGIESSPTSMFAASRR